jgi:nitrous oxidase accessory protein NosD
VIDRTELLVGEPGAVVRGGIRIRADDVTVRGVTVRGGENGIDVDGAQRVLLDRVRISGARLDGIHVRRSSVTVRDCEIDSRGQPWAQAIDISFAFDLKPSVVQGCRIVGGREGIVSHFAHVSFRGNDIASTKLHAIAVTEMSEGAVERNTISRALGVGIYCGDYSMCAVADNTVAGTRPDLASGDRTRLGWGILAHFGATVELGENTLGATRGPAALVKGSITRE